MDADLYQDTVFGEVRLVRGKGYRAYYPNPLPPSIDMAQDTVLRLADAEPFSSIPATHALRPLLPECAVRKDWIPVGVSPR